MDQDPKPTVWASEDAVRWLGAPRAGRYLDAASGDLDRAMEVYQWNAVTAAAALVDVRHLEVAMRNAYDRELRAKYPDWLSSTSRLWSRELGDARRRADQRYANGRTLDALEAAARSLRKPTPGHIIANTSFGLWCNLTDHHREPTLWTPVIQHAYPPGTKRGAVHRLALNSMAFRNRLAHGEPVFTRSTALAARIREVRTLHALLDPVSADWAYERSGVGNCMAACPVPGLVKGGADLEKRPTDLLHKR